MSTALPTHEVVAVFPAEIKAGVVRLPVRMHGEKQLIVCSSSVARGIAESLRDAGIVCEGTVTPDPVFVAATHNALPVQRGRRGPAASRDYWRRMRQLRLEYDTAPRSAGSLRDLCVQHGINYRSVWTAFKDIREGRAPYADEEPTPPRLPILKPNGKTIL